MFRLTLIIAFILIISSCSSHKNPKNPNDKLVLIQGSMLNGAKKSLHIQKIGKECLVTIDTVVINNENHFNILIAIDLPGFYSVSNEKGHSIMFPVYGNDTVTIKGDYADLNKYELSGSEELLQINLLHQKTTEFLKKVDEFARITNDSIESPNYTDIKQKINNQYHSSFEQFRDFSEKFIEKNQGSLASLLALSNQLGPEFYVFHPVKDMSVFLRVDSALMKSWPETEAVQALHRQMLIIQNQQRSNRDSLYKNSKNDYQQ